jgi:hypothetical protein
MSGFFGTILDGLFYNCIHTNTGFNSEPDQETGGRILYVQCRDCRWRSRGITIGKTREKSSYEGSQSPQERAVSCA